MIIKLIVALHLSVSHSFRGPGGEGRTNSGQMKQMSPDLLLDPLFHEAILQRGFNEGGVGAVTMALGARTPQQPFVFHWKWSPLSLEREQHDLQKRVYIQLTVSQSMPAFIILYTFPFK